MALPWHCEDRSNFAEFRQIRSGATQKSILELWHYYQMDHQIFHCLCKINTSWRKKFCLTVLLWLAVVVVYLMSIAGVWTALSEPNHTFGRWGHWLQSSELGSFGLLLSITQRQHPLLTSVGLVHMFIYHNEHAQHFMTQKDLIA